MNRKLLLLTIVVFSLFTINSVGAASFDSSIDNSTLNAGSNILVNFTVNNTDANIVQINITLPSNFSYYGSVGTTSDGSFLPTPTPRWYNDTTSYIIASGGDEKFWFKVTTPSSDDFPSDYDFQISTKDVNNVYNSNNVTVTVSDQTAPTWSGNTTTPSSPTQYVFNKSYTFNITWNDNIDIDRPIFEWNGATNYTNSTTPEVNDLGSGSYGIVITDLQQDNYTYRWFANDTSGQENVTDSFEFNVTKADNPMNIYINGNLNQNVNVNDGQIVNVTADGGNPQLFKDGSAVSEQYIDILPIGSYDFKVNSSGNRNYSINSTGITKTLNVIYPPPRYSLSTDIPSTWSNNTYAIFNATWSDDYDSNGYDTAFIELNHTGTLMNYTMSRISGTNTSTYQLNITQPMTLRWKIYANNSQNTWNSTSRTNSTINKITPTITLTVSPGSNINKGTKTTVLCSSDQVSVTLYRAGSSVSNPEITTLSAGSHIYKCNNSITSYYSSVSATELVTVYRYSGNISFYDVEEKIDIIRNSTNQTTVIIENTGNTSQNVNFTIENLKSIWYSINSTNDTIAAGGKSAFLVNFTSNITNAIKEYPGTYKVSIPNNTLENNFTIRILPDEDLQTPIQNNITLYRLNLTEIWTEINKTKKSGGDVTEAEQFIIEANEKIETAQSHIDDGDYFSAYQLLNDIDSLLKSSKEKFSDGGTHINVTENITNMSPVLKWTIIGVSVTVLIILGYLLWPQPGYDPKKGEYRHRTPKEKGIEKISDAKKTIKSKINGKSYKPKIPKLPTVGKKEEVDITSQKSIDNAKQSTNLFEKVGKQIRNIISKIKSKMKKKPKEEEKEYIEIK